MNIYKNVRVSPIGREEMARQVSGGQLTQAHISQASGQTPKFL